MNAEVIGYARVSTEDQNLDLQRDALQRAGSGRIYEDRMSGTRAVRPGLALALEVARAGDQLVVWRLDRLGRSMTDLIALTRQLQDRGVELRSLTEVLDRLVEPIADDVRVRHAEVKASISASSSPTSPVAVQSGCMTLCIVPAARRKT